MFEVGCAIDGIKNCPRWYLTVALAIATAQIIAGTNPTNDLNCSSVNSRLGARDANTVAYNSHERGGSYVEL
jgi:hypothetical protein